MFFDAETQLYLPRGSMNNFSELVTLVEDLKQDDSKIYLCSDVHLDHGNIIDYCHRPFSSVEEMNSTIIDNWNNTVKAQDIICFLGDLTRPKIHPKRVRGFMSILNGQKICIKGNHDKFGPSYHHLVLEYQGKNFYLVHRPCNIQRNWQDWAICGHSHDKIPFIDHDRKRINVSVEHTNYTPVSIDSLVELIDKGKA